MKTSQADAAYRWQLNGPRRLEPEEEGGVTVMRGDDELKERVHLYLTPGVSAEPAEGWNLRAGVHLPVTSARGLDWRVIVIATKGSWRRTLSW